MMHGKAFVRGLAFGAAGALATAPALMMLQPIVGGRAALGVWSALLAAGYLGATAPDRRRGLRVALAALALGLAVVWLASPASSVMASGVLVATFRSGFLYRGRPARSVVLEAGLLIVGLSLAEIFAARGGLFGLGFGVWVFFLVASLYFLVGGTRPRPKAASVEDAFERATRNATRLMEEWDPAG